MLLSCEIKHITIRFGNVEATPKSRLAVFLKKFVIDIQELKKPLSG